MDIVSIKKAVKTFVSYNIENEYKVYRLKHTPVKFKFSMRKKYDREYAGLAIDRKKIVFDNYMGSGYGCNCKYVTEKLLEIMPGLDIVWTVKNAEAKRADFPTGVRIVEYRSKEAFKEYATARIWVGNYHLVQYFNKGLQKKKEQVYIQMWHGSFGIKKIENDCHILTEDTNWSYLARKNSMLTDYWISNSTFETEVYKRAFWNVENVLEYGHPRNDILVNDSDRLRRTVRSEIGLREGERAILYLPTFRDNSNIEGYELEYKELKGALERKFGNSWKVIIRMHPRMAQKASEVIPDEAYIINATAYPDIQELLVAADAVITDYSSGIFDFMLTKRPGFIFATEPEVYESERGLYYPLTETPFPVARNNTELQNNIEGFDQVLYEEQCEQFLKNKGSVEDGNASLRVAELIRNIIEEY